MIEFSKIDSAKKLIDELEVLRLNYEALEKPLAHVDICQHQSEIDTAIPVSDELVPGIKELIAEKIDEKWNELGTLSALDTSDDSNNE